MQLTAEILADARDLKSKALETLFTAGYAPARRIAHALSGDARIGKAVAEVMIRRSLKLLPRWQDPSTPENWFYHHAVLTTRGVNAPPPDPHADPLVVHSPAATDLAYLAFIRALRHLPPQQREAFILHHGERLNPRILGVAMDCSTQAASTHLQAATEALNAVTEGKAEKLGATLTRAYAAMQNAEPEPAANVRIHVRRIRQRLWLQRAIGVAIIVLILGVLGLIGWFFRDALIRLITGGS